MSRKSYPEGVKMSYWRSALGLVDAWRAVQLCNPNESLDKKGKKMRRKTLKKQIQPYLKWHTNECEMVGVKPVTYLWIIKNLRSRKQYEEYHQKIQNALKGRKNPASLQDLL